MSEALKAVSAGFKLVYIGLILVVLAVVIGIVGGMVVGAGAAGGGGAAAVGAGSGLELAVGGLSLVGIVVGLIGRFKCLAVPTEAGSARPMIVVSVALEVVSLLIALMFLLNEFSPFLPLQVAAVAGLSRLAMELTASILFLLFTKETALYVRKPALAGTAMSVLWLMVTTLVLFVVSIVIVLGSVFAAAQAGGPRAADGAVGGACVGLIVMLVGLVVGLVTLIRYANLLIAMSNATLAFARRGGADYDDDEYDRPRARRRDEDDEDDDRPRGRRRDREDDEDDDRDDDRGRPWDRR
ncbi:MAG: hypothetical protein C0501_10220 [Isosphaera sp.]|nr:hypothetical protein [Isosphaera sp.]